MRTFPMFWTTTSHADPDPLFCVDNCATDGKEADAIYQMFASSRDYRDSIDVVDNGPIRKAYVLYLDIADEAGGNRYNCHHPCHG